MLHCVHKIEAFHRLLEAEDHEANLREIALRANSSPKSLEAQGLLLRNARITDERASLFGRVRLTLREDVSRPGHFGLFNSRAGNVVRVRDESETLGIIAGGGPGWMAVVFDQSLGADVSKIDLELAPDLVTLQRLKKGLEESENARGRSAKLIDIVMGAESPRPTQLNRLDVFDPALNTDQREAVRHGIGAPDIALIHGPPGTGKSRTLVEVIRQCIDRGESVLCLSASNAAVDNLSRMVIEADRSVPLVRLGHPARAHAHLEEYTLAGLTEKHPQRVLAKALVRDALALLKGKSSERGRLTREEREEKKNKRKEAAAIFEDVRRLEKQATQSVMDQAKLVCGTLTGFSREIDADKRFDVLVVDEASQALSPALLLGILRANRLVLAGDHLQLSPTILSKEALKGGLGETAFEALMLSEETQGCRHMLTVQHRMPEVLMNFPSKLFYEDRLEAHESVRQNSLVDLGIEGHASLELVDTSGAGLDENRQDTNSSIENPGQAELVVKQVRALVAAGLAPEKIGVIAPYSAQVVQISNAVSELIEQGLEVDSVDGFQGREKEVIIFDAVRSNTNGGVGFLGDQRRLNVALTRAKRKLYMIADAATLSSNATWAAFFDYAMNSGTYRSYFELEYGE